MGVKNAKTLPSPSPYKIRVKHTASTNAIIILFFVSALLIMPINFSAPGIADYSILPRFFPVLRSLSVYPSIIIDDYVACLIILEERAIVLSSDSDSLARLRSLLLTPFSLAWPIC